MKSDKEMAELESMKGDSFETMWLEMMIEHHERAIEKAEDEREGGVFQPARKTPLRSIAPSRPRSNR